MAQPQVHTLHESGTGTWQYIVADPETKTAVVIDPVLNFDPAFSKVSTTSADEILKLVKDNGFTVSHILETHAHADHLTASRYLQSQLGAAGQARPQISIGAGIVSVQQTWAAKYNVDPKEYEGAFDRLFEANEEFSVGKLHAKVLHLPGHTPDHVGYVIGDSIFTGDSIFNPDLGSARCDFPGGSATDLFATSQRLLAFPDHVKLYTGHDYPAAGAEAKPYFTVADHKKLNKHFKLGTQEQDFVKFRSERDAGLAEPKLIHQALQVNIRAGRMPADGLLRVPVKAPEGFAQTARM